MNILQVIPSDEGGGAQRVSLNLHDAYRKRTLGSWIAVGYKTGQDEDVFVIPNDEKRNCWARFIVAASNVILPHSIRIRGADRMRRFIQIVFGQPIKLGRYLLGQEDFDFPGAWSVLDLPPQYPDLIHCHNLHGDYFDLMSLPKISRQVPTIITLHDAWLLSGHCAHSFDCNKWKTGCGACPDLKIYPKMWRDATSLNWRRKQQIFSGSRLYITTPSQWLMNRVEQSMLDSATAMKRVIPNGVDLSIFKPADDRLLVRKGLDLPSDAKIVMFAAYGIRKNIWKDYKTMKTAVNIVSETMKDRQLIFFAIGEKSKEERIGKAIIRFVPFQRDPNLLTQFYQAADLYIHAALADTFPNSILEALACGTPAVATAVGGIPEQIQSGITGFLTPPGDATAMAEMIRILLEDDSLRLRMGQSGARDVRIRFSLDHQVNQLLGWYSEVIDDWKLWKSTN